MRVYIDKTPNPNIFKFVCDRPITDGAHEFTIHNQPLNSPVAKDLLQFPFITKVYITANFVAVEKNDTIEWEMAVNVIKEIVNKHLDAGTLLIEKVKPKEESAESLYIEMTPNPDVMKFTANRTLYNGIAEARNKDEAQEIPLALALFEFDFVKEVFITDHYVSITKSSESDWNDIAVKIRDFIIDYLNSGKEIISSNYNNNANTAFGNENREFSEIENQIKEILAEYVIPAVAGDGGNIELIGFEENTKTARMLLQGACSGCPSSTLTLKQGIETLLKDMLPGQVEYVEAING
mgnify:CR=1 FL=1